MSGEVFIYPQLDKRLSYPALKVENVRSCVISLGSGVSVDDLLAVINSGKSTFKKVYYNYKHFGVLVAYKATISKFFSSIFKLFVALVFFNKKHFLIHYYRLNGLFNAFLKKPAWLRPDNV